MKNKKINYLILTILLVVVVFSRCKESDFNLTDPSAIDASIYYKTPYDAINAVNAVYRGIYGCNPASEIALGEDATANNPGDEFDTFTIGATSAGIAWDWPGFFGLIYQANVSLSKIPGIDFAGYTGTNTKASLIAQATFLRAVAYLNLVKRYGGVPLITEPLSGGALTPEKVQLPRATAGDIFTQIEKDLKAAIPDLPTGWDDINVGRVTKGAAIAYLGKLYMYQKKWAEAKSTFESLFALKNVNKGTNNGYALLTNFADNFNLSANQKWGSEAIWQVSYTNQIRFANGANWGGGANQEIGKFLNWGGPKPNLYAVAQFEAADTRLAISISGTMTNESSLVMAKYGGTDEAFNNWEGTGKYEGINWQLLRFADAVLMYAEACNELTNTATAITNLNMVRARVQAPLYPSYTFNPTATYTPVTGSGTQADVRNAIKHERLVEFYMEDMHYWDVIRWNDGVAAFAAANAYQTSKGSTNSIQAWKPNKNELWPIPIAEYQLNKNIGAQNPGY